MSPSRVAENSIRWPPAGVMSSSFGDVGQEAHVGHVVGLVEDRDLDVGRAAVAPLDEVVQPARCRHDDVDAAAQRVWICRPIGAPPKTATVLHSDRVAERLERLA